MKSFRLNCEELQIRRTRACNHKYRLPIGRMPAVASLPSLQKKLKELQQQSTPAGDARK